ncbi:hypothetical protein F5Y19DRAFT_449939 [Xylariaceae sp. FL1651]|nr:hypothetical protein F5Y19DRAFT_449939 [Xylariaceae sp. FL1651]
MEFPINDNASIRRTLKNGLGLFAAQQLSIGVLVLSERPLTIHEDREQAISCIATDFATFNQEEKEIFTRFFAGPVDTNPLYLKGDLRSMHAALPRRLKSIVKYNSVEGQGVGCFIGIASSTLNHDCLPNCFIYYDHTSNLITLHALRPIAKNEELTISYLQETPFLSRNDRRARLAN